MYVNSKPRHLRFYLDLLEPLGLRWEAERWFDRARVSRGRRNTPLPADGWLLLHSLVYRLALRPDGTRMTRATSTTTKCLTELSSAIGQRYRHPAFSGVAFAATSPLADSTFYHLGAWSTGLDYRPFAAVDSSMNPGTYTVLRMREVWVNNIGQCYEYRPISTDAARDFPWDDYDPANPLKQQRWVNARYDLEYGLKPSWY